MFLRAVLFLLMFASTFSAAAKEEGGQTKILFIGDSLVAGYGVEQSEAFVSLIEKKLLEDKRNVEVINAGVSGSLSSSGLSRLEFHLKRSQPDILVLALGANDALKATDPEVIYKNLSSIIKEAKEKKLKVLILGMKFFSNFGEAYAKSFEQVYYRLSQTFQLPLMPFLLEGVAGDPKLNLSDGIHPNAKGHEVVAERLLPYLEKLL